MISSSGPQSQTIEINDKKMDNSGLLLALETSGKSASVALGWPDGRLESAETDPQIGSARTLAPAIATLLKSNLVTANDLAAIAVTVGPGSFTGLRVGVSVAKSMAYGLKIPLVAVDTLETIALRATSFRSFPTSQDGASNAMFIWTVLDAYRGQLFAALWRIETEIAGPHSCQVVLPSHLVDLDAWVHSMEKQEARPSSETHSTEPNQRQSFILAGPGLVRCKDLLSRNLLNRFSVHPEIAPHASMVEVVGRRRLNLGQTMDAFQLMPVYLRASAAEEKRTI
ncbi:MAG: tRNA (adenosine(37)-N6)-threonylcarbamoyltransferase complex dimerization subunit type 1 TsaB [Pirellulaceae bacterium]|nr:tRNA (adenosine(37)-N6)-threonylcarbamoyltransferase complex dimerization subunit type 1 TsaB [Pirellulaceae bacterium]